MAVRRRVEDEGIDPTTLPEHLAAGPDPRVWSGPAGSGSAWVTACSAWSVAAGLGRSGWRELLREQRPDVAAAVSAVGRMRRYKNPDDPSARAPWERS